ncbi:MAG: hypothetical protein WC538_11195 [Thermoanaerobaculia bacterium]|jgi:hypothetical protein
MTDAPLVRRYPSARYLGEMFRARFLSDPAPEDAVPARRLNADDGFAEAVLALRDEEAVGIPLGDDWGVIRRDAVDRVIFRCWLFGIITLVEMRLRGELARRGPERWYQFLSPARVDKARAMKRHRQTLGQDVDTIHNLQFGDLGIIAIRDDEIFDSMRFESKRKAKEFIHELETLRNNLAHSQEIARWNWPVIVQIAEISRRIIAGESPIGHPGER